MKIVLGFFCLLAATSLSSGCVYRTTVKQAEHRGEMPKNKKFGADPHDQVIDKKIIWIWQDEFRNAK